MVVYYKVLINNSEIHIAGISHIPRIDNSKTLDDLLKKADIVAVEGCVDSKDECLPAFIGANGREYIKKAQKPVVQIDRIREEYLKRYCQIDNIFSIFPHVLITSSIFGSLLGSYSQVGAYFTIFGVGTMLTDWIYSKIRKEFSLKLITCTTKEDCNLDFNKLILFVENLKRTLSRTYRLRDIGMAYALYTLSKHYKNILTVVGASHAPFIRKYLTDVKKLIKEFERERNKFIPYLEIKKVVAASSYMHFGLLNILAYSEDEEELEVIKKIYL